MIELTTEKAAELANELAARLGPRWRPMPYLDQGYTAVLDEPGSHRKNHAVVSARFEGGAVVYNIDLFCFPFTVNATDPDPTQLLPEAIRQLKLKLTAATDSYEQMLALAK